MFEFGDSGIGQRLGEAWREVVAGWSANETLIERLRDPLTDRAEAGVFNYARMRGGLEDVERTARYLQLTRLEGMTDANAGRGDPAPTAAEVFNGAGAESLAQAAAMWRDLQGIVRLIGEDGFDATAAGPKVRSLVASACGHEDFDALEAAVAETANRAAAQIDTLE